MEREMISAKGRLEAALREAERELQELDKRLDNRPEFDFGEDGSGAYLRGMAVARRERVSARIKALREALVRVREGTYGRCEPCGARIDPERLDILPATSLCAACARAASAVASSAKSARA
jgi:RNA polymerase-binding transcription factor DksA